MDNSNLREDQKKTVREVLMLVNVARRTLEMEGHKSDSFDVLNEAIKRLGELNKA